MVVSQKQSDQVMLSIAVAEQKTSGEIVAMLVHSSSVRGHIFPIIFSVLFMLTLGIDEWLRQPLMFEWSYFWIVAQIIVLWVLSFWLSRRDFALRWVTLKKDLRHQVENRAEIEFFEAGLQKTEGETGVLIFVSLAERQVVVLADKGIAKKLPPETWNGVVEILIEGIKAGDLAQGFVRAIERVGEILAPHFPPSSNNKNELCDRWIIKG